jgi:hypothetical protein
MSGGSGDIIVKGGLRTYFILGWEFVLRLFGVRTEWKGE